MLVRPPPKPLLYFVDIFVLANQLGAGLGLVLVHPERIVLQGLGLCLPDLGDALKDFDLVVVLLLERLLVSLVEPGVKVLVGFLQKKIVELSLVHKLNALMHCLLIFVGLSNRSAVLEKVSR